MAKKEYEKQLKINKNPVVKFTGGGSGSGKSELVIDKIAKGFDGIIYDGTLSNYDSAVKKINQAIKAGKKIEIDTILPRLESAWKYVQKRRIETGRGVPLNEFIKKHVGFVNTFKKIIKNYPNIEVGLKDTRNVWTKKEAKKLPFITDRKKILNILDNVNYNKNKLNNLKYVKLSEKSKRKSLAAKEMVRRGKARTIKEAKQLLKGGRGESYSMVGGRRTTTRLGLDKLAKIGENLSKYTTQVGITPFKGIKQVIEDKMIDDGIKLEKQGKIKEAKKIYINLLKEKFPILEDAIKSIPDITINKIAPTKSNFFGEREISYWVDLQVKTEKALKTLIVKMSELGKEWNQNNVHVSQILPTLPKGKRFGVMNKDYSIYEPNIDFYFDKKLDYQTEKEIQKLAKELDLAGFTFHPDEKGINLYNISKFENYEKFNEKIDKFRKRLQLRGMDVRFKATIRKLWNTGNKANGATLSFNESRSRLLPEVKKEEIKNFTKSNTEIIVSSIRSNLNEIAYQSIRNLIKEKKYNEIPKLTVDILKSWQKELFPDVKINVNPTEGIYIGGKESSISLIPENKIDYPIIKYLGISFARLNNQDSLLDIDYTKKIHPNLILSFQNKIDIDKVINEINEITKGKFSGATYYLNKNRILISYIPSYNKNITSKQAYFILNDLVSELKNKGYKFAAKHLNSNNNLIYNKDYEKIQKNLRRIDTRIQRKIEKAKDANVRERIRKNLGKKWSLAYNEKVLWKALGIQKISKKKIPELSNLKNVIKASKEKIINPFDIRKGDSINIINDTINKNGKVIAVYKNKEKGNIFILLDNENKLLEIDTKNPNLVIFKEKIKQAPSLEKLRLKLKSKNITKSENVLLKNQIRAEARTAKEVAKETAKQVREKIINDFKAKIKTADEVKKEIVRYANEYLPLEARKNLLNTVKNAKTYKNLEKAKDFIDRIQQRVEKRQAIDNLKNIVKKNRRNIQKMRPEYKQEIENILKDLDLKNTSNKKKLSLQKTKKYLENNPDNIIPDYKLKELELLNKKPVKDLNIEEIRTITQSIQHLIKLNNLKNKIIFGRIKKNADEVINEAIKHVEKKPTKINADEINTNVKTKKIGKLRKIMTIDQENIITLSFLLENQPEFYGLRDIYNKIVNSEISKNHIIREIMFNNFTEGRDNELRYKQTADSLVLNNFVLNNKKINIAKKGKMWSKAFSPKEKDIEIVKTKLPNGKIISLTHGERIALYLHSLNTDNLKRLLNSGFSFSDSKFIINKIGIEDLNTIINSLTPEEKQVANAFNNYFNKFAKKEINKASMELNGFNIATEENYFPMIVNPISVGEKDYLKLQEKVTPNSMHNFYNFTLEGMGILKPRTGSSKGALILEDVFRSYIRHRKMVGIYIGFANPLRQAKNLIYNKDFRIKVSQKYGEHHWNALSSYVQDMEANSIRLSTTEKLALDLINVFDPAILGANPWVIGKQPISYLYANLLIDTKYINKGIKSNLQELKRAEIEMKKYSPQFNDRLSMGRLSKELGEIADVGETRRIFTGETSLSNKLMEGIRFADRQAIARIWIAVKAEVKDKYPYLTGDNYWKVVTARAEQIVNETQPTSYLESRSAIGRNQSPFIKLLTKYTNQRNKNLNLLIREKTRYDNSKKTTKDKMRFVKSVFIITFLSALLIEEINQSRNVAMGKKPQSALKQTVNMFGSVLSYSYFVGDIFNSLISKIDKGEYQGWDNKNIASEFLDTAVNAIANSVRAIEQVITQEKNKKGEYKWKGSMARMIKEASDIIGEIKGLPIRTWRKLIEAQFKKIKKVNKSSKINTYNYNNLRNLNLNKINIPNYNNLKTLNLKKLNLNKINVPNYNNLKNLK